MIPISVFRRQRGGTASPFWSYKFTWRGRQILRRTNYTAEMFANAGGAQAAERAARKQAVAHLRDLEGGLATEADARFRLRAGAKPVELATIGEILDTHERLGQGKAETAHGLRQQLRNILNKTGTPDPTKAPGSLIDAPLVKAYRAAIEAAIVATSASESRAQQMRRTAAATINHARAMFSPAMLARYRDAGLALDTEAIGRFRVEPLFGRIPRTAYNLPSDAIIAATLSDLERLRAANRNLYVAVWLIIGFGLRRGEIAGLRVRDIEMIGGRAHAVICETWPKGHVCNTTKNRDTAPKIPIANGAWPRLLPYIEGRPGESYILAGDYLADRLDYVARDMALWMRGLGWTSQKTMHELRSWAICQVGYAAQAAGMDPLETMRGWARHGSRAVTEKHYGRYFSNTAPDAPLNLPPTTAPAGAPPVDTTPRLTLVSPPVSNPEPTTQTVAQ